MFLRALCIVPDGLFCGVAAIPTPVRAEDMMWAMLSKYKYIVQFKLYSEDRQHVWPSSTTSWELDDYASHVVHISCIRGEKICYGAWAKGNDSVYWGAGYGDHEDCDTCCAICGDGYVEKTLLPN